MSTHALEFKRDLTCQTLIASPQVGSCLGFKILLFALLPLDLSDEFFAEPGMGRQALIVLGDLLAQVFLFELEQGLGVAFLESGDEQAHETAE